MLAAESSTPFNADAGHVKPATGFSFANSCAACQSACASARVVLHGHLVGVAWLQCISDQHLLAREQLAVAACVRANPQDAPAARGMCMAAVSAMRARPGACVGALPS